MSIMFRFFGFSTPANSKAPADHAILLGGRSANGGQTGLNVSNSKAAKAVWFAGFTVLFVAFLMGALSPAQAQVNGSVVHEGGFAGSLLPYSVIGDLAELPGKPLSVSLGADIWCETNATRTNTVFKHFDRFPEPKPIRSREVVQ